MNRIAVVILLATIAHAAPPDASVQALFESEVGVPIGFVSEISCLLATFQSQFALPGAPSQFCAEAASGWTSETSIPGLSLADEHGDEFAGSSWFLLLVGLRSKVWSRTIDAKRVVVVAFRHQESDSFFRDEMQEAMSQFGRHATVDTANGNKEAFGAAHVAAFMRLWRKGLSLDFLPQALAVYRAVRAHFSSQQPAPHFLLSGFSLGGYFASAVGAAERVPVVSFAGCGFEDLMTEAYSHLFPHLTNFDFASQRIPGIFNFAHCEDRTPRLDCQSGFVCEWSKLPFALQPAVGELTEAEAEKVHVSWIFGVGDGDSGSANSGSVQRQPLPQLVSHWNDPSSVPLCRPGFDYSREFGSCAREAARWQERLAEQQHRKRELDAPQSSVVTQRPLISNDALAICKDVRALSEGTIHWESKEWFWTGLQQSRLSLKHGKRWADYERYFSELRAKEPRAVTIYFARHGQGEHNVAEHLLGSEEWETREALKPQYLDAMLTPQGIEQAETLAAAVAAGLKDGLQIDAILVSPLSRAIQTALIVYRSIIHKVPVFTFEESRETLGKNMCDKRRTLSELKIMFPAVDFRAIASEHDPLFTPERETDAARYTRASSVVNALCELGAFYPRIAYVAHNGIVRDASRFIMAVHNARRVEAEPAYEYDLENCGFAAITAVKRAAA